MSEKTQFDTGAVRDTQAGKPNFLECMSPFTMHRYGAYMAKASAKYGEDNWTKGIPPESYLKSLERHLMKLKEEFKFGFTREPGVDHAAAIMFNIMGFIHEEEVKRLGLRGHSEPVASPESTAQFLLWSVTRHSPFPGITRISAENTSVVPSHNLSTTGWEPGVHGAARLLTEGFETVTEAQAVELAQRLWPGLPTGTVRERLLSPADTKF